MAFALPPGIDLCQIPVAPNPSGAPPNFVDPPTRWSITVGAGIPLATIALAFVVTRVFTNLKTNRKLAIDDYICVFAWLTMTTYVGLGASGKDTVRHMWDIPLCKFDASYAKVIYVNNLIIGPALWASKAAILTLYARLFKPERWLVISSYTALLVMFLFYWTTVPLASHFCTPRADRPWGVMTLLSCSKLAVLGPIQGAFGVAADIFIFILPIPVIMKLQLSPKKRLGLLLVFLVAILAVVASVISLVYRVRVYTTTDTSWASPPIWAGTYAECYTTIACSCVPAMSAFWANHFVPSRFYKSLQSYAFFSTLRSKGQSTGTGPRSQPVVYSEQDRAVNRLKSGTDVEISGAYYEMSDQKSLTSSDSGAQPQAYGGIRKKTTIEQYSR